jgi:lipid-A-disaccharide synthase
VTSRTIYFVAGEASGDNHGAALMRALRDEQSDLRFTGRGGPQMKAIAGNTFENWIGEAAVVGLWDVIKNYGYFRAKFAATIAEIEALNPAAVILIDYPGFNLRLARTLRRRKISPKIIYYISPQVWAWHRGRISHMARRIDLMLCIFPFEADLYNKSGLRTRFVGHPMIARLAREKIEAARRPDLVGLFPGSRGREVEKIFPILIDVMQRLRSHHPELQFEVAAASVELAQKMERLLSPQDTCSLNVQIKTGNAASLMQRAAVGIVASGSATLEAAYFRLPFVLVYKVAWLTYLAARIVVRVEHLGMPNLLAGRTIVPEFIQHLAEPQAIASAALALLEDAARRARMVGEFDRVMMQLGEGGASGNAAREIVAELNVAHYE